MTSEAWANAYEIFVIQWDLITSLEQMLFKGLATSADVL